MKTMNIFSKIALASAFVFAFALQGRAQFNPSNMHFTVDWQVNSPSGTGFAEGLSGWGMNFEGTYEVTPSCSVGAFFNFQTNHDYVGRGTIFLSDTESLTSDQMRSAYQLPFGVTASYNIVNGAYVTPYFGAKAGAVFARNTTYLNSGGVYDSSWGFYFSPEVGLKIYPSSTFRHFGFHLAGYYNYMTNHTKTLTGDIDGQSNVGFRLGVIF